MGANRQAVDRGLLIDANGDGSGGKLALLAGSYVFGQPIAVGSDSDAKLFVGVVKSAATSETFKVQARRPVLKGATTDPVFAWVDMPTFSWVENAAGAVAPKAEHVLSATGSDVLELRSVFTGQIRVGVKAAGSPVAADVVQIALISGSGA